MQYLFQHSTICDRPWWKANWRGPSPKPKKTWHKLHTSSDTLCTPIRVPFILRLHTRPISGGIRVKRLWFFIVSLSTSAASRRPGLVGWKGELFIEYLKKQTNCIKTLSHSATPQQEPRGFCWRESGASGSARRRRDFLVKLRLGFGGWLNFLAEDT